MNAMFLSVNGVMKQQLGKTVLYPIELNQFPNQRIAIAGETGSGKSTLLKIIAGLIQPDAGEVIFQGARVLGPLEVLLPGHPSIAYLSQHFELRSNYRVHELLEMHNKLPESEAAIIYEVCRIDHLKQRKTDELSGGEKQRIALAKLLSTAPALLLLDEPFSNLDRVHKQIIQNVIEDICSVLNITCMLVSHDATDVLSWADRMIILKDGKQIQEGTPKQLYYHPVNEYVAALLGEYNLIDTSLFPGFIQILGEGVRGKRALIRPEQFSLNGVAVTSLEGIVQKILFYGNHNIAEVLVEGMVIKIRTAVFHYHIGDKVRVQIDDLAG